MYQQQQPNQNNQGQNFFNNNTQQCKEDALRNCRKWISTQNNNSEKPGQIFTILNYNILRYLTVY